MRADEKVGPQGANPGETDNKSHDQAAAENHSTSGDGAGDSREISFLRMLAEITPLWLAEPTQPGEPDHDTEYRRPRGWQENKPEALERAVEGFRSGTHLFPNTPAICANMGGVVVVVDVDPRNGGGIEKVRNLLNELKVRIFAEVATPSGGRHFYIAGHKDLPTVHSSKENQRLPGYPGVDIQSHNTNVFVVGTRRPKYGGAGYTIVFDHLDALINEGDPEGAESFAGWVSDQTASHVGASAKEKERSEFAFDPAPVWDGTTPDERQQRYLDSALADEAKKMSAAKQGGRNDALNIAALKLGHYVAGAGLDQDRVIAELELAAIECGLVDDDGGVESAKATIRSGLRAGIKTSRAVPHKMSPQEFWESTDTLRHVRDFARARRAGPWSSLGVCMARVVAAVPPTVQLPPLVGGNATLNLFVGLVAESGYGKGTSETAARDAFRLGPIYTTGVGSGEGINHMYAHYDKEKGTVMDRRSVLFSVPEIDTLTALGNRNGTTLWSQFRKGFSGEALTFGYVDRTKAIVVDAHSYRLSLIVGIQPGRGRALLEDSDGGTPQRFIWLPTHDPEAPREPPRAPKPIDLTKIADGWSGALPSEPVVFTLPTKAKKLIDDNAWAKLRGKSTDSALDGHLGLCRIKVAAALALLHNEREVTDLSWDLSEVVMDMSRATRAGIEKHLAEQGDKANRARGRAEGIRSVVSEETREDAIIARVSRNILRHLDSDEFKGEANWSDIRDKKIAKRDRDYFDDAIDALKPAGQIEVIDGERGQVIKLAKGGR